ncbi:hypothetical protein GGX14DRAFT_647511 [Mycena pura]|uniref:Uncharacterized protein n=1 Tax=Mycena pura TaxID=153505 RepID=A0AAD6V6Q9_9AGAR|nr:hypothetical protein GGX14DRAFT_647511 [Mycena pura]
MTRAFYEHEHRDGVPGLCSGYHSARRRSGCIAFVCLVACAQEQSAARMGNRRGHRCGGGDSDGVGAFFPWVVTPRLPSVLHAFLRVLFPDVVARRREDTATGDRYAMADAPENVVPQPPHIAAAGNLHDHNPCASKILRDACAPRPGSPCVDTSHADWF